MPICPRCHDTYVDGVERCSDCGLDLLPDGAALPPRVDRLLGTFDPAIADRLTALLTHRSIPHRLVDDGGLTEVIVERDSADELRAELLTSWSEVVASLDPDQRAELPPSRLRGWTDAPSHAWVDRDGQLQVQADEDTEAVQHADRLWGTSLLVAGGLLILYGWYANAGAGWIVAGLVALCVGIFLPR